MADANLTQAEADALIAMEKRRSDDTEWSYPDLGGHVTILSQIRDVLLLNLVSGKIRMSHISEENYDVE